jgi:outer membrane protein
MSSLPKKSSFLRKLFVVLGLSLCVSSGAVAEFRVATVDMNRVLNESKDAQGVRKKLEEMQSAAAKKLESKRDALKQFEEKLKAKAVTDDSKEAEIFRAQAREFERLVKDTREDMQKEFMRSNKGLSDKTLSVVQKYASSNKIDLVLDKSQAVRGPVLYAGTVFDITDDIVKALNE